MNTLRRGSAGTDVSILQLALKRAGFDPGKPDGIFGEKTLKAVTDFQRRNGLVPDGIAGEKTWNALTPYLTGYIVHTIESGDTFYLLAQKYGTTTEAIFTANPGTDAENLPIGANLTVPLGFPLVTGEINFTYTLLKFTLEGLAARYPFISGGSIGKSVGGREQYYLKMGSGQKRVMFNAAHHANEWITVPTVLKFFEQYAESYSKGESIYGADARNLFENVTLYIVPMVNPDGVELVTGALTAGQPEYEQAKAIAARYPAVEFPNGWKANIAGYDLNLNYPAGWEQARDNKYALGFTTPAPLNYVGTEPLSAPESRAMYDFTVSNDFLLTLSYHAQGEIIYWKYLDYEPQYSYEIAKRMEGKSGYVAELTPYAAGFAGYKDWFILQYNRPGYTIEVGKGKSPLPLEQFDKIYSDNTGIFITALVSAATLL